ncbi:histidine phosphatase family protein [Hydrocarboniphaga effusa]|uniref:histidine phosphatase family protein n=1 Tax=Hydrocarboniphaga effusa TaxID=243629 RepID=UPI00398BBFE6
MSVIVLVRHGQASFGTGDYDRLSAVGWTQARLLGSALASRFIKPDLLVCGDMLRHRETANACIEALSHSGAPRIDAAWNEYDHEALIAALRPEWRDPQAMMQALKSEPDPRRAFQRVFSKAVERWMRGDHDGEYALSWSAFRMRVRAALLGLHEKLGKGGRACVFTSGGPIAAVAAELLGLDSAHAAQLSWSLVNTGMTRILGGDRGLRLGTLNEHAHLEHDLELITYR